MLFSFLLFACASALPFDLNLEAIGGAKVRFSLMNTEIDALTFLRWGTPLDKSDTVLRSDMFAVENESGERATYSGIIVKRLATVRDFIGANPGQTLVAEIDLTNGYTFSRAGTYTVWLSTTIMVATNSTTDLAQFEPFEVTSEAIKIQISPSAVIHPLIRHPLMRTNLSAPPTLSCSSSQISDINTADTNGKQLIKTLQSYLTSCDLSGYTTWMGKCDDTRYKTVDTNVDAIASRINGAYQVDCDGKECSDNIYAYVYPSDSTHTVYVCGVFWSSPVQACRYDSKPGTLIHEISHFNDVAGTGDHAYGQSACQNLASSTPGLAIRNADSYEYFSESCYS